VILLNGVEKTVVKANLDGFIPTFILYNNRNSYMDSITVKQ